MAFGGALVTATVGSANDRTLVARLTGVTLAARVGAPAIAAADTGEFTTAAPVANQTAAPQTFGWGRGRWLAGDEAFVNVEVHDTNEAAQGGAGQTSLVHMVTGFPSVVAGDLLIRLHNRGAQASGSLIVVLTFNNVVARR